MKSCVVQVVPLGELRSDAVIREMKVVKVIKLHLINIK